MIKGYQIDPTRMRKGKYCEIGWKKPLKILMSYVLMWRLLIQPRLTSKKSFDLELRLSFKQKCNSIEHELLEKSTGNLTSALSPWSRSTLVVYTRSMTTCASSKTLLWWVFQRISMFSTRCFCTSTSNWLSGSKELRSQSKVFSKAKQKL